MGSGLIEESLLTELGLLRESGMIESQNNRRFGVACKCQKPGDSNYCNDPQGQRGSQWSQNHTKLQRLLVIYNFPRGRVDWQPTWELFSLYWQKEWDRWPRGEWCDLLPSSVPETTFKGKILWLKKWQDPWKEELCNTMISNQGWWFS